MKTILNVFPLVLALCFVTSCATQPPDTAQSGPVATCHVCRYNHDLACVRIHVKESTPHTEYQGATYYFCSADCREAFLKKPLKYLPESGGK